MGRGDRRTRKGKIWRGSHGKTRPGRVRKRSDERRSFRMTIMLITDCAISHEFFTTRRNCCVPSLFVPFDSAMLKVSTAVATNTSRRK